jgi:hypothetical protein
MWFGCLFRCLGSHLQMLGCVACPAHLFLWFSCRRRCCGECLWSCKGYLAVWGKSVKQLWQASVTLGCPASVEAGDNCVTFGCSWPSPVLLPDSSDPKEKKKHVDRMHRKRRFREASVATPNSLGRSLLGTVYLINLIIYYYHIWCHMIWVYYYYYCFASSSSYYYYVLAHIIIWLWSHIL